MVYRPCYDPRSMVLAWFGRKGKARRVPDGQFEKRRCPECGKTTVFRECVVKSEYTVYSVVKLWDSEKTQFACDACGSLMDLDDSLPPELSEREKQQQERLERKQAAIDAKKSEVERRQAQRDHEQRENTRLQAVEDELAEMKKRLGLD